MLCSSTWTFAHSREGRTNEARSEAAVADLAASAGAGGSALAWRRRPSGPTARWPSPGRSAPNLGRAGAGPVTRGEQLRRRRRCSGQRFFPAPGRHGVPTVSGFPLRPDTGCFRCCSGERRRHGAAGIRPTTARRGQRRAGSATAGHRRAGWTADIGSAIVFRLRPAGCAARLRANANAGHDDRIRTAPRGGITARRPVSR